MKHIKEIVENVLANEEEAMTTGLRFLDENMGGLYPGELTTLFGVPDSEKSALMIRQITCLAIDKKIPVLMVLNGTNKRTFLACMAAYYCSVITEDVRHLLNDIQYKNVVNAFISVLKDSPLYIMGKHEFVSQLKNLQPFVEKLGIRAIFIENSKWLFRGEKKQEQLGQTLKQLAMKLNVVVVAEYIVWHLGIPSLSEVQQHNDDGIFEFADNIIHFIDCSAHEPLISETDHGLKDLVELRIVKHKGVLAKDKSTRYRRVRLLVSNNHVATKIYKDVAKKVMQSNKNVNKLISALDCELVTDHKDDDEI